MPKPSMPKAEARSTYTTQTSGTTTCTQEENYPKPPRKTKPKAQVISSITINHLLINSSVKVKNPRQKTFRPPIGMEPQSASSPYYSIDCPLYATNMIDVVASVPSCKFVMLHAHISPPRIVFMLIRVSVWIGIMDRRL